MEVFLKDFNFSLDKQQLFYTAVFYNKSADVEYLLRNYSDEIDPFFNNYYALRMAFKNRNMVMLTNIVCLAKSTAIPMNVIEEVPPLIVFILPSLLKARRLTKQIALKFLDIAMKANDRVLMNCLINNNIEDFISDYRFAIIAAGANRLDIIQQENFSTILSDMIDECVEMASLCHALDTLKFLTEKFHITNPNIKERVRNIFLELNWKLPESLSKN